MRAVLFAAMRRWPRCSVLALFRSPSAGAGAPFTWTLLGRTAPARWRCCRRSPLRRPSSPIFGPFVAGAIVAGMALAVGLHAWNSRHPTAVACTRRIYSRYSGRSTSGPLPVGGNIGGFFFVAGQLAHDPPGPARAARLRAGNGGGWRLFWPRLSSPGAARTANRPWCP